MNRILALSILAISLPAFGAANLTKQASQSEAKVSNKRAVTTTKATTAATPSKSGKSSLAISEVRASKRPVRLVPMLGVASFRMPGMKIDGATIRSDEGLAVGIMGDYKLNPTVTFQGGLSYLQLGAKANADGLPVTMKAKIDYLAITTGAKFYSPNRIFYGKGALATLFNTRSDYEIKSPVGKTTGKIDDVRDMDILLQVGGGLEFPINPSVNLGAELTFNRGLIDVTTGGNGTVYNEGFLFSGFVNL